MAPHDNIEVKVVPLGNHAVPHLAEADAHLKPLTVLKKNHDRQQYSARCSLRQLPVTIANLPERLSTFTQAKALANAQAGDPLPAAPTYDHSTTTNPHLIS
jgi:hypothetical protein